MEYTVTDPQGNEHVLEGPAGATDAEILQQAQTLLAPSKLESFGRGALNNFPLANQAVSALGSGDYSQNMKDLTDKAAAAKQANPISYGAGAVTGAVAPLAIPGVGEGLEAAPVAGNAALGAANAISNTDVTQDPGEAVKQAVTGGTIGAVAGKLGSEFANKGSDALETSANASAVQSMGLRKGMLGIPDDELDALGSKIHELGLDKGSIQDRAAQVNDLVGQVGAQISDIGAGAQPLADATPFINQLHEKIAESSDIFGAGADPEAPLYRAAIDKLSKPGVTFDELQQIKQAIGKRAFDATGQVKNDGAANIYGVYRDAMKSIVSSSPQEYQEAMQNYSMLKDLQYGLNSQLQSAQASGIQAKGFGMVGKLAGMMGDHPAANVGVAAALAPAHPFMAMGALTPLVTNPQSMSAVERGLGEALPSMARIATVGGTDAVTAHLLHTLNSNPQSLGKFAKPLMQAGQTGGSQGIAATHFILMQTQPEYNKMMMEGSDENANQ